MRTSGSAKSDRRRFLRRAAGVAALAAVGATAQRVAADPALDALMGDGQHGEFGQSFDQASRTIHMPKATAPTLSPQTARLTEQAVKTYDGIVARGGWPQVPRVDELHLGMRHPSVVDLRRGLSVSGDLDPERGRQRYLRFLCRGGGAAVSGPPWLDDRRRGARRRR